MSWRQEAEKTTSINTVNNPRRARANNPAGGFFNARGATEISRCRHPKAPIQFFAPEAQRTLDGGGAQRNHRNWPKTISRPGRDAGPGFAAEPTLDLRPSGARSPLLWRFRWLRCAPPPANVRCPSGTKIKCRIFVDTDGRNHWLIAAAPPAQNMRMSQ